MELKQAIAGLVKDDVLLLIVPYGIETCSHDAICEIFGNLLIVPYGIETEK